MRQLDVRLLGRFEVFVDSRPVPADAWAQRRAADLVKLLALAPSHRVPRDEVLEMLWPKLGADAAASNLHKAASYARRALGERGAVVLRGGMVELAPDAEVTTDVERFERGDDSAYGGELLPDDPYERLDSRLARAAAGASARADAHGGPLGGGPARGRRRRGGSPGADAPPRGERRPAGRGAPVPPAARRALAAWRGALGGDAGPPARAHARPRGSSSARPPRPHRRARARPRARRRVRCSMPRPTAAARCSSRARSGSARPASSRPCSPRRRGSDFTRCAGLPTRRRAGRRTRRSWRRSTRSPSGAPSWSAL